MAVLKGRWYLAGVVSFGTQRFILILIFLFGNIFTCLSDFFVRCDSSLPGVYTRVSSFWQWIEEVIGPL